ncbi:hypothetical protein Golax_019609 [Gossypium laxum]|uniref:Phosphoglycolate phosphatase n=1 Tax=Gossypium laxum TaxID=34288 RepID=A0A7J8Z755_9ROSI|nr:hypothetical protein [Gossypium laxum]
MATKAAVSVSVAASITAASSSSSKFVINTPHRFLCLKRLSSFSSFSASALAIKCTTISNCSPNKSARSMEGFTTRTRASAQPLENADELIASVETFIFDCDGVIWKGDKLIDGVPETLDMLRSKGKRLVFVTNNSTKSRKQYGKKFETLGLNVNEEEIFASSFAAAAYLKSINFPKDKKVYVIGEDGILKELELAGFQYLGGPVCKHFNLHVIPVILET